jgi:hypothetical protein
MNALPGQMELATVIDHRPMTVLRGECKTACIPSHLLASDTHTPPGIRLAKMLSRYEDSPSSQLWSEIQSLAREILR